jgi:hypothetical protein
MSKETITIYWAPAAFNESEPHWNMLYQNPVSVVSDLNSLRDKDVKQMFTCPAYIQSMKNVFVFKNVIKNKIQLDESIFTPKDNYPYQLPVDSVLNLTQLRESSLVEHINVSYNMSWLLFADEPVEARFTAPYFPSSSPAEGAMLAVGEFNIGSWYRDYVLDYHIPYGTKQLSFEENQPLFYVEIKTNKNVVFKRYKMTDELKKISAECAMAPTIYRDKGKPLSYRYNIFKKTSSPERVLSYIKNNLID